jgi:transposase
VRVKKQGKHYTAEEKVAILRRRLVENVAVSDLCEELGLQPTVFYRWQKEFLKTARLPSNRRAGAVHQAEQERIEYLEKKIQTKDDVLEELMAEHIALKKSFGEL